MSVNGVTNTQAGNVYQSYTANKKTAGADSTQKTDQSASSAENDGVIYESSDAAKTYKPDTAMINKLKADADARTQQLQSLVQQLMTKQGNTYGAANDIWKFLSGGNFTVDAATKAQAQADIAEDGYWGVNQTSDRILDFATALTGGDPDKIEEMRSAFKKGYEMAEKKWGGKLPDISQKTYDAVMEKFDKLKAAQEEK